MNIKLIKRSEKSAVLRLEGRLDTTTAPSAQEAFLKVAGEYPEIELDFTGLEYISSAGLRALLVLQKQMNRTNGHLTLTHVAPSVKEVFEITGFSGMMHITG